MDVFLPKNIKRVRDITKCEQVSADHVFWLRDVKKCERVSAERVFDESEWDIMPTSNEKCKFMCITKKRGRREVRMAHLLPLLGRKSSKTFCNR